MFKHLRGLTTNRCEFYVYVKNGEVLIDVDWKNLEVDMVILYTSWQSSISIRRRIFLYFGAQKLLEHL